MRYLIRETRHRYAGAIAGPRVSYIDADGVPVALKSSMYVRPFESRAAAQAWIAETRATPQLCGNGECRPPTYRAVPKSAWPDYLGA